MILRVSLFLAACALCAAAQDELHAPPSYVKLDTVGPVQIFAKNEKSIGPTAKTEFVSKVREIYTAYKEMFHLDVAYVTAGADGGTTFKRLERQHVELVLFDNDADRDDWFLKAGVKGDVVHTDKYQNAIGYAMTDGVVGKEAWVNLWRAFSHVFIWHHLYFGAPPWLDHGLAEYYAWSNKQVVKPAEHDAFNAMIARLRASKDKGTETPIDQLLLKDPDSFGQDQIDESWVLIHFLMTEWKATFDTIWLALATQQSCADDRADGVITDARRFIKFELERAFGNTAGLQAAWNFHRDALLKSVSLPAKFKGKVYDIREAAAFMLIDFSAVPPDTRADPSGALPTDTMTSGSFAYTAPWPGPITVTAAIGDGNGKWSKEYEVTGGRADKKGTPVNWSKVRVPLGVSGRLMRITVTWEADGGGVYQWSTVKTVEKPR